MENAETLLNAHQLSEQSGITYLNLCAVHSQSNDHDKAMEYSKLALIEFQNQLLDTLSDQKTKSNAKLVGEKA